MRPSIVILQTDDAAPPSSVNLVRIEPSGIEVPVAPGSTLMKAGVRAGLKWPSVCGGQAQCGVCAVEVLESCEPLPPPSLREQQMLDRISTKPRQGGTIRLACQFAPHTTARVFKPGIRKPAAG